MGPLYCRPVWIGWLPMVTERDCTYGYLGYPRATGGGPGLGTVPIASVGLRVRGGRPSSRLSRRHRGLPASGFTGHWKHPKANLCAPGPSPGEERGERSPALSVLGKAEEPTTSRRDGRCYPDPFPRRAPAWIYLPTISPFNPEIAVSTSCFSFSGTLNLSSVATRCFTLRFQSSSVMFNPVWTVFMSRPV